MVVLATAPSGWAQTSSGTASVGRGLPPESTFVPPTDCTAHVGYPHNQDLPGYVVPDEQLGRVRVPFTQVPLEPGQLSRRLPGGQFHRPGHPGAAGRVQRPTRHVTQIPPRRPGVRIGVRFASRTHIRILVPSGSLAGVPAWRRGHDTNWLKRAVPRALEALFAQ